MRDLQLGGRSPVYCMNGAAASSHPLSSLAAIDILQQGGNAVDAAIAACAVQCVVEPMSTGIGGDCFAMLQMKGEGPVVALNGSGYSAGAADVAYFEERNISKLEVLSPHCVTVPGAVDAWATLSTDYGKLGLDYVLQPAIRLAEEGFAVTPHVSAYWADEVSKLSGNAESAALLLSNGRAPLPGEKFALPKLGQALRAIAAGGRDAFYQGAIADDIVNTLSKFGGLHTLADLERQRSSYEQAVTADYRGHRVAELPPNSQGIVALLILKLMEGFNLREGGSTSVERYHIYTEAVRLAYAVRNAHVSDPRSARASVSELLDDRFVDGLRSAISLEKSLPEPEVDVRLQGSDTVYLTVVDRDLNCVSFINSLFSHFGSGLTSPKFGITLQNRGMGFSLDRNSPNCIGPRKRPLHTLIPAMLLDSDNRCEVAFGVMGGQYQAAGHAFFVSNLVDFGMDTQAAIDAPRLFPEAGWLDVETPVDDDTIAGLAALGHPVRRSPIAIGGGQAIRINRERGVLEAGSDHRKDGCALGY
ncbi:gamma-glutamyltransferase (plasmid) [Mesorhizobium sp. ORM8.1]